MGEGVRIVTKWGQPNPREVSETKQREDVKATVKKEEESKQGKG